MFHPGRQRLRITEMTDLEPHCLVTGSTGYVGSRLVPCLLQRGMRIRVLVRSPAKLDDAPWRDDVEVVQGDLTDAESLDAAFAGIDIVYHLVHAMGTTTNSSKPSAAAR